MNTTINKLPIGISVAKLQKIENINYHIKYHTTKLGMYTKQPRPDRTLIKEQQFMIKELKEELGIILR